MKGCEIRFKAVQGMPAGEVPCPARVLEARARGQWRDPGSARIGDCGHGHDWCGKMLQHSHVNRAPSLAAGRLLVERVQLGIRDDVVRDVHDHILSEPQRLLLFPSCIPAHVVPAIAAALYVGGAARVSAACRNIDRVRWGRGDSVELQVWRAKRSAYLDRTQSRTARRAVRHIRSLSKRMRMRLANTDA